VSGIGKDHDEIRFESANFRPFYNRERRHGVPTMAGAPIRLMGFKGPWQTDPPGSVHHHHHHRRARNWLSKRSIWAAHVFGRKCGKRFAGPGCRRIRLTEIVIAFKNGPDLARTMTANETRRGKSQSGPPHIDGPNRHRE
jgi:hypothetical protein